MFTAPPTAFANEDALAAGGGALQAQAGNSVDNATSISLNEVTSGWLSKRTDEDWYRITLPKAGKLQILFGGEYNSSGNWEVSLRDSDNTVMWSGDHNASENLAGKTWALHTTGLPAGTFYIRVYGDYSNGVVNKQYDLTPSFTASGAWETELNDTVVTTDPIPLGSAVHGTMRNRTDEDWYRITLPKSGAMQLKFLGAYCDSGNWEISLRDSDNKVLWSNDYAATTKAARVYTSALTAGTYYIRVYGDYSNGVVNKQYDLTPNYYVAAPSISKVTAAKKAFTVKWSKSSGVTKYQVRYSLKKNMSGAKVINVSKSSSSKKISSLKAKKKYYVQVRAVKSVSGKAYCSSWSSKRSVKTK